MAHRNRWFTVLKNWWIFHGKLLNNRMVYIYIYVYIYVYICIYIYSMCVVCAVISIDLIKTAPDGNLECQLEI